MSEPYTTRPGPDDEEKQVSSDNLHSHDSNTTAGAPLNGVTRIQTSGDGDEFVIIGNNKYYRHELLSAFGGTLTLGLSPPPSRAFANPLPLGLSAFALTTFVLSLVNAQLMGVTVSNIVVGLAMFYGGLVQLLAGMWEMALENTFGALALSSYGGFWMLFGAINIPWFGIIAAYEDDPRSLEVGIGFFLLGWTLFTFMILLATVKSTILFFSLFLFLDLTFLMLSIGHLSPSTGCNRAGGVLGVITAFILWYNAYAGLANHENAYLTVKGFPLPVYGSRVKTQ